MKYILLGIILIVSGCGWVTQGEIERAIEVCKGNGGVDKIVLTTQSIYCNNGASFPRGEK